MLCTSKDLSVSFESKGLFPIILEFDDLPELLSDLWDWSSSFSSSWFLVLLLCSSSLSLFLLGLLGAIKMI